MTVGPFRDFQTARIIYLEGREQELLKEIARLRRPPLWQRMGAHPLFQGAWHFMSLIMTYVLGLVIIFGAVCVLVLFGTEYYYVATASADAAIAAGYPPGLPPPRFSRPNYADAGPIAGVLFPPKSD